MTQFWASSVIDLSNNLSSNMIAFSRDSIVDFSVSEQRNIFMDGEIASSHPGKFVVNVKHLNICASNNTLGNPSP